MKNLEIYFFTVVFLASCTSSTIEVKVIPFTTTAGTFQLVYNAEEILASTIDGQPVSMKNRLERPGFAEMKVAYLGGDSQTYLVYLEGGNYTIRLRSLKEYPDVTSKSTVQRDLQNYYKVSSQRDSLARAAYSQAATAEAAAFRTGTTAQYNLAVKTLAEASKNLRLIKQDSRISFIKAYPASLVSAYLLTEMEEGIETSPATYLPLYNSLSELNKSSVYGKKIKKLLDQYLASDVNAVIPEFSGDLFDRKDFDKNMLKGKVTLISFWASWMVRQKSNDISGMKILYDQYHSKGFEIVGLSADKQEANWIRAIKENEMDWIHFCDFKGNASANLKKFSNYRIPYYILVGPDLKIVERDVDLQQVKAYLEKHNGSKRITHS